MDPSQMHMLKQFGHGKIVCIDGTHGLNAYDFELVTLLVVDDFGSGFHCCFMFTNLKDTQIYTVMFSTISIYKRKYTLPIINVQPKLPYGFI